MDTNLLSGENTTRSQPAINRYESGDRDPDAEMLNARGWKVNEPGIEFLAREKPSLPTDIGATLKSRGFDDRQAAAMAGYADPADNPFRPDDSTLHLV